MEPNFKRKFFSLSEPRKLLVDGQSSCSTSLRHGVLWNCQRCYVGKVGCCCILKEVQEFWVPACSRRVLLKVVRSRVRGIVLGWLKGWVRIHKLGVEVILLYKSHYEFFEHYNCKNHGFWIIPPKIYNRRDTHMKMNFLMALTMSSFLWLWRSLRKASCSFWPQGLSQRFFF